MSAMKRCAFRQIISTTVLEMPNASDRPRVAFGGVRWLTPKSISVGVKVVVARLAVRTLERPTRYTQVARFY